jgi:hypothetical protein
VDIMTRADGIDTRAAIGRAAQAELGTFSVPIVSLADLNVLEALDPTS